MIMTGGAGHLLDAKKRNEQNLDLLKTRHPFGPFKKRTVKDRSKVKQFPSASQAILQDIRNKMKEQRNSIIQKSILRLLLSLLFLASLLIGTLMIID